MAVFTNTASMDGYVDNEPVYLVSNTLTLNIMSKQASGTLTKSVSNENLVPGVPVTFTLVLNITDGDLVDFAVRDVIDSRLTVDTSSITINGEAATSQQFVFSGGMLSVPVDRLGAGETLTITFQVTA